MAFMPCLSVAQGLLTYKPPQTGTPQGRLGGGTRMLGQISTALQLLAPEHTALTAQAQPVLYWYLTAGNPAVVDITLAQEGSAQPLLEQRLSIDKPGLQRLSLAENGVSLKVDEEYYWSIVLAGSHGMEEAIVSARFRYALPSTRLVSIEQLAAAGYWYDVLNQLVEQRSPVVNDLLKQIGIDRSVF